MTCNGSFRRVNEADIGKAFIREATRTDRERFGRYSVLRSMGSGLGGDPLISFWTFDIIDGRVVGKHVVSDHASTKFCEARLEPDVIQRGIEACEAVVQREVKRSRQEDLQRRLEAEKKSEEYNKPGHLSFVEESTLQTIPGKYCLWIDDVNRQYQIEVYAEGHEPVVETLPWGHEPRFGVDVEDLWKLFGNQSEGTIGLLGEIEARIRKRT